MKELSIEEKAKAYDKAIGRVKKWYNEEEPDSYTCIVESIFPELKESEDEEIRKWLISQLKIKSDDTNSDLNIMINKAISWLEKRGEQKLDGTFVNVDDVREDFIQEVYRVLDADSTNDRANQIIDAFDNLPTVTIKQDPCEHCKMTKLNCYSFPCDEKREIEQSKSALEAINEEKVDNANKVEPKQEELTEFEKAVKQVMEEAIECGDTHNLKADAEMLLSLVQKPAWSEEDEYNYNTISHHLDLRKEKYKKECNQEEQERYQGLYNWFKSLKNRVQRHNTWKPREEQLKMLDEIIDVLHRMQLFGGSNALIELRYDLKKLRGE